MPALLTTSSDNHIAARSRLAVVFAQSIETRCWGVWRCAWSSTDSQCSNYIWAIINCIAYWGATYIRDLTVCVFIQIQMYSRWSNQQLEQLERLRSDDIPPAAPWLLIPLIHIGSQVKTRQSQSYKFIEFSQLDLARIVEDTERTPFCPQTDRRTRWNQYTPLNYVERGYNKSAVSALV